MKTMKHLQGMSTVCRHQFELHIGIRTSFGVTAWVPLSKIYSWDGEGATMQRCVLCGEQGYEVPDDR